MEEALKTLLSGVAEADLEKQARLDPSKWDLSVLQRCRKLTLRFSEDGGELGINRAEFDGRGTSCIMTLQFPFLGRQRKLGGQRTQSRQVLGGTNAIENIFPLCYYECKVETVLGGQLVAESIEFNKKIQHSVDAFTHFLERYLAANSHNGETELLKELKRISENGVAAVFCADGESRFMELWMEYVIANFLFFFSHRPCPSLHRQDAELLYWQNQCFCDSARRAARCTSICGGRGAVRQGCVVWVHLLPVPSLWFA